MKETKTQKGITLIALIITIVILIILAVVAINAIDSTDILSRAESARDKYQEKVEEEKSTLKGYNTIIGQYTGENGEWSNTPSDPAAPTAILGVSTAKTNQSASFTVKATGGTGAIGYQYSKDNSNWSATVASGTNYTFENIHLLGNEFALYARAVDEAGKTSTATKLTLIKFWFRGYNTINSQIYVPQGYKWSDLAEYDYAHQNLGFEVRDFDSVVLNGDWIIWEISKNTSCRGYETIHSGEYWFTYFINDGFFS